MRNYRSIVSGKHMRVVIINKSDETGGAAVVSFRLMNALRREGVDARMLVVEKRTSSSNVERAASAWCIQRAFLSERIKILFANGFSRSDLFKVDTASDGLALWRHEWVAEADVICLNWVNQGMLSLEGVRRLCGLGKPVLWTMHDLWCMTGICHHPGDCTRFRERCGECKLLGAMRGPKDLSFSVHKKKERLYSGTNIHFVAVSNWLAGKCSKSSLLRDADVTVIPNAFPIDEFEEGSGSRDGKFRVVMGAARLDDSIKGLPLLIEATRIIKREHPELAARMVLVTFGSVKNERAFEGIGVEHRHLGRLSGTTAVSDVYRGSDCVVSSSLFETLPGTLIEGQACGCIPVSFNRGGQPDIIDHMRTGYMADLSDDASQSAKNLAEGLVWASRQPVTVKGVMREAVESRFSPHSVAKAYIELFRKALQK